MPLERHDRCWGVFGGDSRYGVEDGTGIGVWGCGMVVFVGYEGLVGSGI